MAVPACGFEIGEKCGLILTEEQARRLVTEKDSGLIEGFTSRRGKPFDAHLILGAGLKIRYKFDDTKPKAAKDGTKAGVSKAGAAKMAAKTGAKKPAAEKKPAAAKKASGAKKGAKPGDGAEG